MRLLRDKLESVVREIAVFAISLHMLLYGVISNGEVTKVHESKFHECIFS